MRKTVLLAALVTGLTLPTTVAAQGGPGFLFKNPRVSIGVRTGYQLPRVESDIFAFPLDSLTLERSDFASPYLGGEIAVRVADRLDVAVGVGWARARSESEYVNWVDQDDNPIEQVTTFQTISGSLGAKYYFVDRGRSIGRFAWVPSRVTPYLGGGIGVVGYEFDQAGDWVDFETLEVFPDRLRTTGAGVAGYLAGGSDVALGKQFVLTAEARYTLANGSVGGPYSGFDKIDLAGLQLLAGLALRW
ncbi:MAG TPA: hypothetical protein VM198_06110 [Longimicrobiales bacterium]|nr:hypothetical protein [Longimicrobiales bacterium]